MEQKNNKKKKTAKTAKEKKTKNNAQIIIAQPSNPSRRLPFSDLSNATRNTQPQPQPHDFRSPTQILSTSTSRHIAASSSSSSSSSAAMAPPPSDPHSDRGGGCNLLSLSEQTTVYRRKTATRIIEHTENTLSNDALSCPPRRTKTEEIIKGKKAKKDDRRVISSAPCKRRKKPENFTLPEDFVREQRDYFAKLDEEELIVEEAEREPFKFVEESNNDNKFNQSDIG